MQFLFSFDKLERIIREELGDVAQMHLPHIPIIIIIVIIVVIVSPRKDDG